MPGTFFFRIFESNIVLHRNELNKTFPNRNIDELLLMIQALTFSHWPQVKYIYEQGIASGHATFQNSAPDWEQWDRAHLSIPRLVMTEADRVVAWAALSPVSARLVYAGVAEVSVYVATENQGKGIGKHILE